MASVSIWHWGVVLLLLVGPIVALAFAKTGSRVGRQTFIKLALADVALAVIAIVVLTTSSSIPVFLVGAGLAFIYVCFRIFFIAMIGVRLATLGWSKWWALLGVPAVGLDVVLGIVLCIPKTAAENSSSLSMKPSA